MSYEFFLFKLLISGSHKHYPKTVLAIIGLGDLLEFGSNTRMLKIPYSWVIEHGEIKLVPTWKLHPYAGRFFVHHWKREVLIGLTSCEP